MESIEYKNMMSYIDKKEKNNIDYFILRSIGNQ